MRAIAVSALLLAASAAAQDFPVPVAPLDDFANGEELADLNGDGRADIVQWLGSFSLDDPDVAVTLSLPGGHWADPVRYSFEGKGSSDVAVGLINADGFLDIAVSMRISQTVVVLHGLGGGAFGNPSPYFVGGQLENIELG